MNELILAIDDEPLILRTYRRNLGDKFQLVTAESAAAGLDFLKDHEAAVILSDLRMPAMDGIAFLRAARELRPDAVRMLISGHADIHDATNSVNNVGIFRLMLKPFPEEQMIDVFKAGLAQYRLVHAEKQLLEGTLNGAIQTLTEILSVMDPGAYGHAQLRRRLAREVAIALKQPTWTFEIAALLAEIGRATLPPTLNEKFRTHQSTTESERRLLERVPEFSSRLLKNIPRLEAVVAAVMYQGKFFNGTGFPADEVKGTAIPLAARVLLVVNALQSLVSGGASPETAIGLLEQGPERYDPTVVRALYACIPAMRAEAKPTQRHGNAESSVADLASGMLLLTDIVTKEGMTVLAAGTRLTDLHVQRVQNYAELNAVAEPILVVLP